jgi:hypothetical protein
LAGGKPDWQIRCVSFFFKKMASIPGWESRKKNAVLFFNGLRKKLYI